MTIYNLMTMENFTSPGSNFSVAWIASWVSLLIVFYVGFILRKQTDEGFLAGTNFNVIGAIIVGLALDIVLITFTGSPAWGLLAGIGGLAAGGFGIGAIAPGESSGE